MALAEESIATLRSTAPARTPDVRADPDEPQRRGSLGAVMAVVGAACGFVASRPLTDNSFLTHLATGRLILADGVPTENPFLFTGTAFPVPSWWWSILLAVIDQIGGATGIRILTALVAAALGATLVRLTRPVGGAAVQGGLMAAVVPAVLAMMCVFPFLSGRPHLAGYLLVALALVVWNEERSPWWIVAIFTVFVNVHGSWLYGIAVLGLFGLARAIDDRRIRPRDIWVVVASVVGSVIGGALYPTPFEIVLLPTRQFGDPIEREALASYSEWSSLPVTEPLLWALVVLVAVALIGALRQRRYASAVAVVALGAMGYSGSRLAPIAAVSLVIFAASAMREVGTLALPSGRAARLTGVAAALIAAGTLAYCVAVPSYELTEYPVDQVDWLQERGLVADDARVLTHDYVGNYLEWRFGDRANAYVDDRPDAATLIQYRKLLDLEDGWEAELAEVDPQVVLWSNDKGLLDELRDDPDWVRATGDDSYTVFCASEIAPRCT